MNKNNIIISKIVKGSGRGKKIGFPTLNLEISKSQIPENGVYAAECIINSKKFKAAASIGDNPTFKNKKFSIEVYLFNFNQDLTEKEIKINFIKKIRDQKNFKDEKELKKQIQKDVIKINQILK